MSTNNKSTQKKPRELTPPLSEENTSKHERIVAKEIDIHQYITVRNGFQGKLVYKSSKTGETYIWDEFGGEQEIELVELKGAKNSAKKFFENNWFMFDDEWVIDYLGVRQYYKHAINIEDFDKIFSMRPEDIKKVLNDMSKGQRESVAYRAKVLIAEGEIDSNKAIAALEESLGVELIER